MPKIRRAFAKRHNKRIPVHTLPYELLSDIFLMTRPLADATALSPTGPWLPCLLAISSVCSFWRALALSTALLWTEIHLSLYRTSKKHQGYLDITKDRLRAFLYRSKHASISLTVGLVDLDYPRGSCRGLSVWAMLIPHMARCHNIVVHAHTPRLLAFILPLRGPLSRLQKLNLIIYDDDLTPLPWPDLFDTVTTVREVHLDFEYHELLRFMSPTGTVSDLSVGVAPVHAQAFRAIQSIANCPNVSRVSLRLQSDGSCDAAQLVHPHLFRSSLGLRSLCGVTLEGVTFAHAEGSVNILPPFPNLPLLSLTLYDLETLTVDSLPTLFRSCVVLRKLDIVYFGRDRGGGRSSTVNAAIRVLTDRTLERPLLPALQNLTILAYGTVQRQHGCDAATLGNLLDSRPHLSITCSRAVLRAFGVGTPNDGYCEEDDDASVLESSYGGRFICTPQS